MGKVLTTDPAVGLYTSSVPAVDTDKYTATFIKLNLYLTAYLQKDANRVKLERDDKMEGIVFLSSSKCSKSVPLYPWGTSSRYITRLPLYLWMLMFISCFIALMRTYLSEIIIYPLDIVLYLKTNKYNLNTNHWKRKLNWWLGLHRTTWKHITESKCQEKYLPVTEMNYVLPGKLFVHIWLFIFT